jgi:hypothetical protein
MKELKFIHITKTGGTSIEDIGYTNGIKWGRFHREEYGWWHGFFTLKPKELKEKYDWFVVVRNPYSRIVSEFYCNWSPISLKLKKTKDIEEFNDIIRLMIEKRKPHGSHWSEQYKYIDPNYIIHILKFENLKHDFDNLMTLYGLNIRLNCHSNKSVDKFFKECNLSRETLDLINEVYNEDFHRFNYKKF